MVELDLEKLELKRGSHPEADQSEMCVMEAVSFMAGECRTDRPECACWVISAFLRSWNDHLDDSDRQILKPLIPRLIGTKSKSLGVILRRQWIAADWLIRFHLPAWLELAGLADHAKSLRQLPAIENTHSWLLFTMRESHALIDGARKALNEIWLTAPASRESSEISPRNAAKCAAWDTAGSAARSVSANEDGVWTACDTASQAVEVAARVAVCSLSEEAVRAAVASLQESAIQMANRMIEANEKVAE